MTGRFEEGGRRTRATDHVAVAVGTTEGLFLVADGIADGPFFPGCEVPSFLQAHDRYLAAVGDPYHGVRVCRSDDGGTTWQGDTGAELAFPEKIGALGARVARVWQLHRDTTGISGQSGSPVVFAGVEPASLFGSVDGGVTFELVHSLWQHPDRESWAGGGADSFVHTILTHPDRPDRLLVGISGGGVYCSEDGGRSFEARNDGLADGTSSPGDSGRPRFVHKLAIDAAGPDVLWLQNQSGVYRSDDAGRHWDAVSRTGEDDGLPSNFGFALSCHPIDHDTCFVFPLQSREYRFSAGGRCRVYRTVDGGKHWEALAKGLPQQSAHVCVLRDALVVGDRPPYVLAFGTRTGQVYASADLGETWRLFVGNLPPVLCVRILT